MILKKITVTALASALAFANCVSAEGMIEGSIQAPVDKSHFVNECQKHMPMNFHSFSGHKIKLLPPQDMGFRNAMGGAPDELSMKTLHAAEGTMYVVEKNNGVIYITFDFHGLIPLGVYSLWNVTNPNYNTGDFTDAPLMDQSGLTFDVNPGRLGAPAGYGTHGFQANRCGSANLTIKLMHAPGTEFLLDYHSNGFEPGTKGETIFPGVLWGKFPDWRF